MHYCKTYIKVFFFLHSVPVEYPVTFLHFYQSKKMRNNILVVDLIFHILFEQFKKYLCVFKKNLKFSIIYLILFFLSMSKNNIWDLLQNTTETFANIYLPFPFNPYPSSVEIISNFAFMLFIMFYIISQYLLIDIYNVFIFVSFSFSYFLNNFYREGV